MRRLLLLLATGFLIAADVGRATALAQANRMLETRRWRMAIEAFETILVEHPTSAKARLGLAVALGEISRCDRSLDILTELRGRKVWGGRALLAEGNCHLRVGNRSAASAAFEDAFLLDPAFNTAVQVAYVRGEEGRLEALEEALDFLVLERGGEHIVPMVRADVALRRGLESFDVHLLETDTLLPMDRGPAVHLLDARRWMDVDHPAEAAAVLLAGLRSNMSHVQSVVWRAEALRRSGQLADADSVLSRPMVRHANEVAMGRSVRARMAVDRGDLDGARLMTAELPTDEEGLATRWYLARAVGDQDAMKRLASSWSDRVRARDRSLVQLIPLHLRVVR